MSARKLRRMRRTELIDVIDTLRQDETPQDTEALRRVDAERKRLTERQRFWRVLRGTVSTLIVVAAIAVLLATLLLPVLQVSGDSMNPTLQDRDVILLVKTDDWKTGDLCGFYWQNKLLLKRIIGGPGDVISIDTKGVVSVNGEVLDEPYVDELALRHRVPLSGAGEPLFCDGRPPRHLHRQPEYGDRLCRKKSNRGQGLFTRLALVRFFVDPLRKGIHYGNEESLPGSHSERPAAASFGPAFGGNGSSAGDADRHERQLAAASGWHRVYRR